MTNRTYFLWLLLALTLLLALRLPFLRCGPLGSDVEKYYDEINYIWLANSLMNGDTDADTRWAWTRAPGTALVLAGLGTIRGLPAELVICDFQIIQVAIWAMLLFMSATVAARLFDRRTAVITAMLFAALPLAASLTVRVYSETLGAAGILTAIFALVMHSQRRHVGWLILAGIAAGFGALSRSAVVPLIPVLALWAALGLPPPDQRESVEHTPSAWFSRLRSRFCMRCAVIFTAITIAMIAPWTLRNYLVHGGFILIDTTGAYTLWSDNKASTITVESAMWAYSNNPVERQNYAMRRAREDILSQPGVFVRKVAQGMALAWRPTQFTSAWDRWFKTLQNRQSRTAALLAQLAVVISLALPLAFLGILFAPHTATGAQSYRWALPGMALMFALVVGLTHYEERFRLPIFIALLPYAAWCLAHPVLLWRRLRRPLGIVALLVVLLLGMAYSGYIWPAQWYNLHALTVHGRGLVREALGDTHGALADQRAAIAIQPTLQEPYLAAARVATDQGDINQSEQILWAAMDSRNKINPDIVIPLQMLLLEQGRIDDLANLGRQLTIPGRRRAEALAWQQGLPPGPELQIGDGSDFGLIQGFYVSETDTEHTFRWSRPEARLLLAGSGKYICMNIHAARPAELPAPVVNVAANIDGNMRDLGHLQPPRRGWAWACVATPAGHTNGELEVHLNVPVYNPHVYTNNRDTRNLGIVLAAAELRSAPLTLDPATGLVLDRQPATSDAATLERLELIGATGDIHARPGAMLPLTLWWRGTEPPPTGIFTFVHLLAGDGSQLATYNAPLAAGQFPTPWVAGEPLADHVALTLPPDLPPGPYLLVAGAFNSADGSVLTRIDLGEVEADQAATPP